MNCLTMLLTPADGSFLLELMDIDVMFRLLPLLMLDGIKPWPMSGRAAVAIGNEAVRAKTTTNKTVAMATDVEVADSNTFNRGMKTVSSSTCGPIKNRKENERVNWFPKNKFLPIIPSVVSSYQNKRRRRMSGTATTTKKRNKNKGAISCMRNETQRINRYCTWHSPSLPHLLESN